MNNDNEQKDSQDLESLYRKTKVYFPTPEELKKIKESASATTGAEIRERMRLRAEEMRKRSTST